MILFVAITNDIQIQFNLISSGFKIWLSTYMKIKIQNILQILSKIEYTRSPFFLIKMIEILFSFDWSCW
jgi:hypothetical protein